MKVEICLLKEGILTFMHVVYTGYPQLIFEVSHGGWLFLL